MENFFEQFEGADLDRLTECLKAIKDAGLHTSKHTRAGINQNSGNVWVWDEDWQGCVYCSICFDVAWSWSCPNCGEEFDFDEYADLENFVSDMNEKTDGEGCTNCCEIEETDEE